MQVPLLGSDGTRARVGTVRAHLGDWRGAWWLWPEDCALIMDPPFGQAYRSGRTGSGYGERKVDGVERYLATGVSGDDTTRERDEALDQPWSVAAVWGPRRIDKIPPWGLEVRMMEPIAKSLEAAGHDDAANWLREDITRRFGGRVEPREILAHDKKGVGMGDLSIPWKPSWESIAIYGSGWAGKRTDGVLRGAVMPYSSEVTAGGRTHPNQKALNVCAELVAKAPPEVEIVDPFAGSFSIPLAAALLGRDCCCAEIDPEHYERGVARLRADGIHVIESPGETSA